MTGSAFLGAGIPLQVQADETWVSDADLEEKSTEAPEKDTVLPDANQYKYQKDELAAQIRKLLTEHGAKAESSGEYPGWQPNINSPILKTMQKVYKEKYGKEPKIMVIHAGLECGILGSKYPNWDMISFGPTLVFPHSPDEALKIETVTLFWDFLSETLKNIPNK